MSRSIMDSRRRPTPAIPQATILERGDLNNQGISLIYWSISLMASLIQPGARAANVPASPDYKPHD